MAMMALAISMLLESAGISLTKERSIFRRSIGSLLR
jgi:hypothetical protein